MMISHSHVKAKRPTRVNNQSVVLELKKKVISALNKLADRDTYQIGVEELERTAQFLTPDGISSFLYCILDTDSEQKITVRKECIRLIGVLATYHAVSISSYLGKIVSAIIKRLKDTDTVMRDTCVETMGVLASKLANNRANVEGVFVILVKPLFEAMVEQNKQLQFGSSLCLAKIIDSTNDPPISVLQPMLTRTVKLLKNPHFLAKPAVIELNRSIIQAGGAATQIALSAAMSSIQDALKSSDWITRKAASVALGEIALKRGAFLDSCKSSCINALDACRFDKVKPVRDTIQKTLQQWKSLPRYSCPELSEVGSSIKGNSRRGSDVTFNSDSPWRNVVPNKDGTTIKKEPPPFPRNTRQNYVGNRKDGQENDWEIQTVHKSHNEESEGSCTTNFFGIKACYRDDVGYEYADEKRTLTPLSNLDSFEPKCSAVSRGSYSTKPVETNLQCRDEESCSEEILNTEKTCDRSSLGSAVVESSVQNMQGFCLQIASEMASVRKQLMEIECKQSNLLELLQVSTTSTMEGFSSIQDKVSCLQNVIGRIAHELFPEDSNSKSENPLSKNPSPDAETCRLDRTASSKKGIDIWSKTLNMTRKPSIQKTRGHNFKVDLFRNANNYTFASSKFHQNDAVSESKNRVWDSVNGFLREGELDAAYVEALRCGDEAVFIELLDKTGPALERLSQNTVYEILLMLVTFLLANRFMNSIIPWLQQVVELSSIHGAFYPISCANAKQELLRGMQEALNMDFFNVAERRRVTQLFTKLHQIWGKKTVKYFN